MEYKENEGETIRSILNNASQRIKSLEDELKRIETPTRNNLELQPPGHLGNRYSIHIEEQKFKLRNEIENIKTESRNSIDHLLSDKSQASMVALKDYKDVELLRPDNFQKQSRDISESQEYLDQMKLESNMKELGDRNEALIKEDKKFLNRFGGIMKNKSDISKEKLNLEPEKD